MSETYREKLAARIRETGSALCVGIDPRPEQHGDSLGADLKRLVEETAPHAAAFKPNLAYFEALGSEGLKKLERLLDVIPDEVPVILDAKRGDIGSTQAYYAKACFEAWKADAVTLNPYLGFDTIEPFLAYPDRGLYLLGVTSNPGAAEIQQQTLADGRQVFEVVTEMCRHSPAIGLVLGLTNATPEVLAKIGDVPLLIPGLGAQGGELAALAGESREAPSVINVSRGILYQEPERTYAEKAKDYADRIADIL